MSDDDNRDRPPVFTPRAKSAARREVLARRALSRDLNDGKVGPSATSAGHAISVLRVEHRGRGRKRVATLASYSRTFYGPGHGIAVRIQAALNPDDPSHHIKPAETFSQMSPEKRAEMERLYGKGPKR